MNVFIKEHGAMVQKDFTENDLVEWFKANSEDGEVKEDILLFGSAEIKADAEGFPWLLSDMTLDRDQERMDPSGWDLKEYRKNPIVLWGHNAWEPAIGTMKNVKKSKDENGALTGTVIFDESGHDPLAMKIASKVRAGILTKGSVGFRTKTVEILDDSRDGTRLIHRKMELMEFSIVNIPSNPNAQVQRSWEGWTDPKTSVFDGGLVLGETEPKHYTEVLLQDIKDHETSGQGETSRIDSLFQHTPETGKSNLQEMFNAKD
jgi:HK97 family phage prohead protease